MARESDKVGAAISRWEVQVRKGVLEFVILLALRGREQYGFELISGVAKRASLEVPEGTLYPLLLRLSKEGLIASRLGEGDGGAPRKYYSLTRQGDVLLKAMTASWSRLSLSLDQMLAGGAA